MVAEHYTLVDPEHFSPEIIDRVINSGTDAVIVGGSTGFDIGELEETIEAFKEHGLPVYLFPNNAILMTKNVDAVLFIQLLNGRDVYWISEVLALGALTVKKLGIRTIPSALLVIQPGGIAGWIADAKPLPRKDERLARMYALAAKFMGAQWLIMDAGPKSFVPFPLVRAARVEGIKLLAIGRYSVTLGPRIAKYADVVVTRPTRELKEVVRAVKG